MKSTHPNKYDRSFPTVALAIGCAALAVVWPGWRSELRAQTYSDPATSAISNIITSTFQFGRPTTQAAQNRGLIRNAKQSYQKGSGNPPSLPLTSTSLLSGGAAGADQYKLSGDEGLFFSGGGSFGDLETQRGTPGFNLYRRNATLGLDHRFSNELTGGLFFNYVSSSANIAQNLGNFQSNIFRFIPYLSFVSFEKAYIDISAGYGYQQNHSNTNCIFCTNRVHANFDGTEYFGSVDFGQSYNISSWTITGYGQGSAFGMNIDRYRETGNGTTGLTVGKQYPLSVTTTLGMEASYAWTAPFGVVVPRVFGEWVHEYKNDNRSIVSQFGSSPVISKAGGLPRNWANVGIGSQMTLFDYPSLSAFVNYQSLVMTGATNHIVEGGIRWEY